MLFGIAQGVETGKTVLEARVYPKGQDSGSGNPIIIQCKGEVFSDPHKLRLNLSKKNADYSTPIATIESAVSADRAGDVDWMAMAYEPDNRHRLYEIYSDKERLRMSVQTSMKITEIALLAKIEYGNYVGFVKRGRYDDSEKHRIFGASLKMFETGEWLITSDMGKDKGWRLLQELISMREDVMFQPVANDANDPNDFFVKKILSPSRGNNPNSPIILYYRGIKYYPGMKINLDAGISSKPDRIEKFLANLYIAYKYGNKNQILDVIRPSERKEKIQTYLDTHVLSIKAVASKINEVYLIENIFYGKFAIAIVNCKSEDGQTYQDSYALVKENESWFLTDKLRQDKDPFLHYFTTIRRSQPKIAPSM